MSVFSRYIQKASRLFRRKRSPLAYWDERARAHGVRSVFNLGHGEEDLAGQTRFQKDLLFPFFAKELGEGETRVLDFGCGPGRFSAGLAEVAHGQTVGVDPVGQLLSLAPADNSVEYRLMTDGLIPAEENEFHALWVCLVLGGIIEEDVLQGTMREFDRVLRPGGLVFLVENTAGKPDGEFWKFRTEDFYKDLFGFADLSVLDRYEDLGERISILAGRKYE